MGGRPENKCENNTNPPPLKVLGARAFTPAQLVAWLFDDNQRHTAVKREINSH